MADLPIIVKVLKYLEDNGVPADYQDIIRAAGGCQAHADRALRELKERGLIEECGVGCYRYTATKDAHEFSHKLYALYDKISSRVKKELLIRGLLSQPRPQYLWKMEKLLEVLLSEGFEREDVITFIEEELHKDYLKRIKMIFAGKIPFNAPDFIPYYNISGIRNVDGDDYKQLKEHCRNLGLAINEEYYLAANYPEDVSAPALHYVDEEKKKERDTLMEEAFRNWQGLSYSWEGWKGKF